MKNKYLKIYAIFIMTALLLTGCGVKSFDTASGGSETYQMISDSAMDKGMNGYREEAAEASAVDMAAEAPADMAESEMEAGTIAPEVSEKNLSSRKLIKTVSLSMETKAFETLKSQIEESITSFGGYIESSSYDAPQGGRQYRYYYLCVRIPAENLDAFVNNAGELGTITSKSENVEDVTLDYVDKTAYKDSLKTEYERVMELLEKASDLDQILALESKLSQLRYEINSYESQLRTYDNQIDYSTVNISISEVQYEKETDNTVGSRIRNGFQSSLSAVRDFFVDSFVFLISNLPVLLLLAAAAAAVIFLFKKVKKKFRKKSPEKNPKTEDHRDSDPS